jgi:hypothetical protein
LEGTTINLLLTNMDAQTHDEPAATEPANNTPPQPPIYLECLRLREQVAQLQLELVNLRAAWAACNDCAGRTYQEIFHGRDVPQAEVTP